MSINLVLPQTTDESITSLAVRAEEFDYDGLWYEELWGTSSVVQLTDIAAHTDNVTFGTTVLNVLPARISRTPAVLVMTAATLDQVSDGRFCLGVGRSTKKVVEDLHGMDRENP